jgi:alanine racemase
VSARAGSVAIVDLGALSANWLTVSARAAPASVAAVVKGDGYGLGMVPAAARLWSAGARTFFVAHMRDAELLRRALPVAAIGVLDGLTGYGPGDFNAVGAHPVHPVLNTLEEVRIWLTDRPAQPAFIHIDTGMNRLGISGPEAVALAPLLAGIGSAGILAYMTHFISSDDRDDDLCRAQVAAFDAVLAHLPPAPRSIANSSGLFLEAAYAGDLARTGKALLGLDPVGAASSNPIRPVLSVYAPILQLRDVKAGDTVGYGATFTAQAPMRIATIGIGYANGYLRSLSNQGIAAIGGMRVPVVGRVSMDLVTLDITGLSAAQLADGVAEMLGPHIALAELAALAGSNDYELQIALGRGSPRHYVGSEAG